jgi:hypothetical protein
VIVEGWHAILKGTTGKRQRTAAGHMNGRHVGLHSRDRNPELSKSGDDKHGERQLPPARVNASETIEQAKSMNRMVEM